MNTKLAKRASLLSLCLAAVLLIFGLMGSLPYKFAILSAILSGVFATISSERLKGFSFTAWVLLCVAASMSFHSDLIEVRGFQLSLLITPIVQVIMFGMGTTLSLSDFSKILSSPWAVLVGMVLQFLIMPTISYCVAKSMGFDGELAAGIILIGSVSGGVASNLMAYIAKANVALSVSMTIASTLVAPFMIPLLMSVFAGSFIEIDTLSMMLGVINIIVIPVAIGLLSNTILYSPSKWASSYLPLAAIAALSLIVMCVVVTLNVETLPFMATIKSGIIVGSSLLLIVSIAKLIVSVWLGKPNTWIDKALPIVSMVGICAIISVVIAQTYDELLQAGLILIVAAVVQNSMGYLLGYWGARGIGSLVGKVAYKLGMRKTAETFIDEKSCRTVAFEVGMQNGGMATGLAIDVLKSHLAALPPNIFGTWMNVSGSLLANWWKQK